MKTLKNLLLVALLSLNLIQIKAQTFSTTTSMHSIGIYVNDADTVSAQSSIVVLFKESSTIQWRNGLGLSSLIINGQQTFAGSLLQLKTNTTYDIDVTITDSFPSLHSFHFTSSVTTQAEPVSTGTNDTLWVSPSGSGSQYSFAQPGSITTLFGADASLIDCGTAILCRGGTYYVGDLDLNLTTTNGNCNDVNLPIIIGSAPGETAIMDGSDTSTIAVYPNWTLYDATNHIYTATLPAETAFSTLMMYDDSIRLFPYATIYMHQNLFGAWFYESLSNAPEYFGSGFYRNGNQYFIRLENDGDPNGHKITVSKRQHFLSIYNYNNYDPKFVIQNLDIQYYGKANVVLNPLSVQGAIAINLRDLPNTIVENCRFKYNTLSLYFDRNSSNSIVRYCNFKDQTGLWMHGKFKNTSLTSDLSNDLFWILNSDGKYGRSLEKAAIFFQTIDNTPIYNLQIYGNTIDGIVNGIGGRQSESSPFYDVDLFDNNIKNTYDAIDAIGNAVNFRVWNNRISNSPVVFSLIPYTENNIVYTNLGPTYIFRNVVDKIVTRSNKANKTDAYNVTVYVNYGGCDGGTQEKVWGTGLKMETGEYPATKRMDLFLIHNTFSSEDSLSYNLYLWKSTWRTLVSMNNSYSSRFTTVNFEDVLNVNNYAFHSSFDNFYSEQNPFATVNEVHGNFSTCHAYATISDFDLGFRTITGNTDQNKLKINSFNLLPDYVDQAGGDFHLNQSSQLIDAGEFVPNISDLFYDQYVGSQPDIGAYEYPSPISVKEIQKQDLLIVYPNPSKGFFQLKLPESTLDAKIEIFNSLGELVPFTINSIQANEFEIKVTNAEGIYYLKVNSGKEVYFEKIILVKQ